MDVEDSILGVYTGFVSAPPAPPSQPCGPGTRANFTGADATTVCLPCPKGTYCTAGLLELCPLDTFGPREMASSKEDCDDCPEYTKSEPGSGSRSDCKCVPDYYNDLLEGSCERCPNPGTRCNQSGTVVETIALEKGFWRWRLDSTDVRPCLTDGCIGSQGPPDVHREPLDGRYCKPSLTGPFCLVCNADYFNDSTISYYNESAGECNECSTASVPSSGFELIIYALLSVVVAVVVMDATVNVTDGMSAHYGDMLNASKSAQLMHKLSSALKLFKKLSSASTPPQTLQARPVQLAHAARWAARHALTLTQSAPDDYCPSCCSQNCRGSGACSRHGTSATIQKPAGCK